MILRTTTRAEFDRAVDFEDAFRSVNQYDEDDDDFDDDDEDEDNEWDDEDDEED